MNRPRLLVVDDDPYTRSALHAMFARQGWEVRTAATVSEGLALLDPAPHCVILDLNLPDGGGEAILWEVRTNLPRTRVAVCSGAEDPRRLELVRRLRPELLLWKPIEMASVLRLCDEVKAASG